MTKIKWVLLAGTLLTCITYKRVQASDIPGQPRCCNPQEIVPAGMMWAMPMNKNCFMVQVNQSYRNFKGMQNGFSAANSMEVLNTYLESPISMKMQMSGIMVKYGITGNLTLMGMGHYMKHTMAMDMIMTEHQHDGGISAHSTTMQNAGWADASVSLLWKISQTKTRVFTGLLGVSAPTGISNRLGNKSDMFFSGKMLPFSMQTGTGTWNVSAGWSGLWFKNKTTYGLQGVLTSSVNRNQNGIKPGPSAYINAWMGRSVFNDIAITGRTCMRAGGALTSTKSNTLAYLDPMSHTANYGSADVSLFIGTQWSPCISKQYKHKFSAEIGHTAIAWYNGYQLKSRLQVNAQYSFYF